MLKPIYDFDLRYLDYQIERAWEQHNSKVFENHQTSTGEIVANVLISFATGALLAMIAFNVCVRTGVLQ